MADFIKGMDLCRAFYAEAVRPVLQKHFPHLTHSAARLGPGSDVLGFDTPMSMDHDWGPRVTLFLETGDLKRHRDALDAALLRDLPPTFGGFPTLFDLHDDGTLGPHRPGGKLAGHGVEFGSVAGFFKGYIGADPLRPLAVGDWLSFSPQHLRTIASGAVFHDGLGQIKNARRTLDWYPRDVWIYQLANQWRRINQEEPFPGRCDDVGDGLGSRLVTARLVTELMRLCLLMEKSYPPYFKWFGTAFALLPCADELAPLFEQALSGRGWRQRERALSEAYLVVGRLHNDLGLTPAVEPKIAPFHTRPFAVPHADRFVEALHGAIESSQVKALPPHVGAVWQFADSTDIQCHAPRTAALQSVYQA